ADECYHLTELGRFAGQGGVEVESIIRLVEALSPLAPATISDPTLIAAAQLTLELDRENIPLNKRGWKKETETWFTELRRQHIPALVLTWLHRFVSDQHPAALRAKKAAACLLGISDRPMSAIESVLTQHGNKFDGAAGPVRQVSSRTADLLPYVARVATI